MQEGDVNGEGGGGEVALVLVKTIAPPTWVARSQRRSQRNNGRNGGAHLIELSAPRHFANGDDSSL